MDDFSASFKTADAPSWLKPKEKGFLSPEKVIANFDLKPGMIAADFGAGAGYFAIPMARTVGALGKIIAVDIQKRKLEIVRSRAKLEHLLNIEVVWGNLETERGSKLKDGAVDFLLLSNILFQIEDKARLMNEAYRVLVKNGRMAVIDWDETEFPAAPDYNSRVSWGETKTLSANAGFVFLKEFGAGAHHYGLMFRK